MDFIWFLLLVNLKHLLVGNFLMIRQANFELKYFALNVLKKHHVFEFSALFARTFNTVNQGVLTLVIHVASTMKPIFTMSSVSLPKSVCSKLDSSLYKL